MSALIKLLLILCLAYIVSGVSKVIVERYTITQDITIEMLK